MKPEETSIKISLNAAETFQVIAGTFRMASTTSYGPGLCNTPVGPQCCPPYHTTPASGILTYWQRALCSVQDHSKILLRLPKIFHKYFVRLHQKPEKAFGVVPNATWGVTSPWNGSRGQVDKARRCHYHKAFCGSWDFCPSQAQHGPQLVLTPLEITNRSFCPPFKMYLC